MPHKTIKKAIRKVKKAVRGKTGDRLPDLPGIDMPLYGPAGGLVGLAMRPFVNPFVAAAVASGLGTYAMLENTEKYWGPPVEAQATWTARQWEEYQNWYEQNIRSLYAGSEIDPDSPLGYMPPARTTPKAPTKQKRKVSKANKAFKKAYTVVTKGFKGKMTRKKCAYFMRKASKMASKANPNTKSRIGKAKNATTRHCRKIRKGVWGVTKRG